MLIVYLSNRYIRVVSGDVKGGKLTAEHLYYTTDTAGCMINGTITDEEGMTSMIKQLWESNHLPKKNVYLVIDSSQFTTKVLELPKQKPQQMLQFLSREYTDVERIQDPIYSYFPLKNQEGAAPKFVRVFSMMTNRSFIESYIAFFETLGISVAGVECATGAVMRMLENEPAMQNKSCIVQFADDMNLLNLLLVNGRYIYSSRSRLFSDAGTPSYSVEIARAAGNILQFVKAQNIEEEISEVYITGISTDDMEVYKDSIYQMESGLQAMRLGDEKVQVQEDADPRKCFSFFAMAFGGMIKTDPKTNLRAGIVLSPEKQAAKEKRRKVLAPVIALGAVLVGVTAGAGGYCMYVANQLAEVQKFNTEQSVLEACEKYDELSRKTAAMEVINNSMTGLDRAVESYPLADSKVVKVINDCAKGLVTATVTGYDSINGQISFQATAENVDAIHRFANFLTVQDTFASVDYTGYTQDAEGKWNVSVSCIMAPGQEDES